MTVEECAGAFRLQAETCGMSPQEFANAINNAPRAVIESAMGNCSTEVLEIAVRFEALAHEVRS